MEEMMEAPEAEGTDNPRLQAILDLLKFLSKSETSRAMPPPVEEVAPVDPAAPPSADEPSPEELEALKAMMG